MSICPHRAFSSRRVGCLFCSLLLLSAWNCTWHDRCVVGMSTQVVQTAITVEGLHLGLCRYSKSLAGVLARWGPCRSLCAGGRGGGRGCRQGGSSKEEVPGAALLGSPPRPDWGRPPHPHAPHPSETLWRQLTLPPGSPSPRLPSSLPAAQKRLPPCGLLGSSCEGAGRPARQVAIVLP